MSTESQTAHLTMILHSYKQMKQLGFQMTEHKEAGWTPNPHMQGHRWKPAWNCAICAKLWSRQAWQSRLWCLMGPAQHSPPSNISVSCRLFATGADLAWSIWRGRGAGMRHSSHVCSTSPSHSPLQTPLLLPWPKKAGFHFPTSHEVKIQHEEREWEEGPWKDIRSQKDTERRNAQNWLPRTPQHPKFRGRASFPSHHQTPLGMQKRWRACTLITYSHADVNLAFHSRQEV